MLYIQPLAMVTPGIYEGIIASYDGNIYKVRFPRKLGPRIIQQFETKKDGEIIDVTSEIEHYLGPSKNFYSIPTSPYLLGYENLIVHYTSGLVSKYEGRQIIEF
jgi:hypothetical protein